MKNFSNPYYAKGGAYPYSDINEAIQSIPRSVRTWGMVVNINWVEYNWKYGLADIDLTLKTDLDPSSLSPDEVLLTAKYIVSGSFPDLPPFSEEPTAGAVPIRTSRGTILVSNGSQDGDSVNFLQLKNYVKNKLTALKPSVATDVAGLVADYNALLAALKS